MFNALLFFLIRERRSVFINKISFFTRFIVTLINFFFYYFASKAFIPENGFFPPNQSWSLFEFVIVGELTLFFVIDALVIFPQHVRYIITENTFDALLLTKTPLSQSLLMMGLSSFGISIFTLTFQILVFSLGFGFTYPIFSLLKVTFLNICFLPLFLGFGFISTAILIITRRGGGGLGAIIGSLGTISGAYFPISVFPDWLEKSMIYLNPLYTLLKETRSILKTGTGFLNYWKLTSLSLIVGILMLALGVYLLEKGVNYYKKKGDPLVLGR